jgi:protease-4
VSLETDLLVDRRRLKRRLFFWRVLTLLVVLGATVWAVAPASLSGGRDHVARVNITGFITDDRKLNEAIAKLADDSTVKAVIVAIDSPGGSVAGGEAIHNALAGVAAKKPVVAVMGAVAASAGYMIAMPAARVFARNSTITGSIGVLLETTEVSGLLNTIGVTAEAITSGPLKDQPSLTRPLSDAGRSVLHEMVMDMYEQFVAIVARGRGWPADKVRALADGRAYTGQQAVKLGLVDAIGGEPEARAWLAESKAVAATLPVEDLTIRSLAERTLGESLGSFVKIVLSQALKLDGAVAVWQPSATAK